MIPNGTFNRYDKVGRVVEIQRLSEVNIGLEPLPDGSFRSVLKSTGGLVSTTSTVYDAAGRVIETIGEDGQKTDFEYDAVGRQTAIIDALGNRTEFEYDKNGRQIVTRDALGRETRFEYDVAGRQLKTIFSDGTFTSTSYDALGRRIAETDQAGKTRYFEYDESGRLVAVELPAVVDPENNNQVSVPRYEYSYDRYGNQTLIKDPKGRETAFTYDQFNRQTSRTLPSGNAEFIEYDSFGRIYRQIDFKGQVIELGYDDLGRQTEKRLFESMEQATSGGASTVVSFTYDALGRQHTIHDPRRGLVEYSYNMDGRMVKIESPEGVINYAYDAATGRRMRTFTEFTDTRYTYDELGRLSTVAVYTINGEELDTPEITTYTYTGVSTRESMVLPNGVTTGYTYDDLDRLTNLTTTTSGDVLLASYTYTLAKDGRRIHAVEVHQEVDGSYSERHITWIYDELDRLLKEQSSDVSGERPEVEYTTEYSYDLVGNRLRMETDNSENSRTVEYTYNDADQLIEERSSEGQLTTFLYDENGSLIEKRINGEIVVEYQYSLEHRLERVTTHSVNEQGQEVLTISTYLYDQSGIRVSKTTQVVIDGVGLETQTVLYLNDTLNPTGFSQVLEERSSDSIPTITYIVGDDVIAQVESDGLIYYIGYDGHGSTRFLMGQGTSSVSRYDYDAFGILVYSSSTVSTTILYTGEQFDSNARQYYLRARYYDLNLGRFNRIDPFRGNKLFPESLHKYLYVHQDPVNGIDPTGRVYVNWIAYYIGS